MICAKSRWKAFYLVCQRSEWCDRIALLNPLRQKKNTMQTEETDGPNKWQGVKKLQKEARLLLNQAKQRLDKDSHLYQTVGSVYFLLEYFLKKIYIQYQRIEPK